MTDRVAARAGRNHYRFRSLWLLPVPPGRVYAVLERAEEYPEWWPQVRAVDGDGAESGTARVRSLLPYDLTFTARAVRHDPRNRVLEIAMTGDMEGWARWTVLANSRGSTALYEQQVEMHKPLLRLLALPGRPLFALNHALMMRSGQRGLRDRLTRGLDDG